MEIEKMSDEELLVHFVNRQADYYGRKLDIENMNGENELENIYNELLKRLKKPEIWSYTNITPQQAVEEFKEKLIDEIYKLPTSFSDNGYDAVEVEEVEKIINN